MKKKQKGQGGVEAPRQSSAPVQRSIQPFEPDKPRTRGWLACVQKEPRFQEAGVRKEAALDKHTIPHNWLFASFFFLIVIFAK